MQKNKGTVLRVILLISHISHFSVPLDMSQEKFLPFRRVTAIVSFYVKVCRDIVMNVVRVVIMLDR